ncbi:hypothetical protein [Arthrobacter agilis]|uniref:hypothetical protein n=1 Tax=Arthrobacter agilis TaxID=37921 RepID=UPI00278ADD31|nr:hypothetical protein [Arthrobacter agilis]MDQ0737113.1 hypothetical protein [Arthrobacter agilis]
MAQQLFHLEGSSLEELKAQAAALYGPRALIVSAELVTVGGIRGVFARKHYEILVEVPQQDDAPAAERPRGRRSAAAQPSGIHALLEQAELDEVRLTGTGSAGTGSRPGPQGEPAPVAVSTDSGLFAALMDNLTFATDPAPSPTGPVPAPAVPAGDQHARPAARPSRAAAEPDAGAAAAGSAVGGPGSAGADDAPAVVPHLAAAPGDPAMLPDLGGHAISRSAVRIPVPAVLRDPGDLVTVIGSPAASWEVVQAMATAFGGGAPAAVAVAGETTGWLRPDARRIGDHLDANAARAAGVDGGHPVFLALWSGDPVEDARLLLALRPDQVWLAVDAGRKEADTAAWAGALRRSMERAGLEPAGLAVVGQGATSTPDTVLALGLPVGWQDGRPGRTRPGGRRRARPAGIE